MKRLVGLLALTAVFGISTSTVAGLSVDPAHPIVGEAGRLTVAGEDGSLLEGVPVTATYYPNAAVERVVELGLTSADGVIDWTPAHAGLVTLSAGEASMTIGVRFTGLPIKGLVVFLIAATLLFGFIFLGTRRILQGDYVDPTT